MCAKKESEKRSTLVLISVTTFFDAGGFIIVIIIIIFFYNKLRMLNDLPVYFLLFETSIFLFGDGKALNRNSLLS